MPDSRPGRPLIIYSDEYLKLNFGDHHPFQPTRFKTTIELVKKYLIHETIPPVRLQPSILIKLNVHSKDYINKVRRCSELVIPYLSEYSADTPCFQEILDWGLTYCGGVILGCDQVISGDYEVVFNVAGGFHHAKYNEDGGFCVFNDCALALSYLVSKGLRPIYIDIDAHAGDGTYLILYDKPIPKISIHEDPRFLYPGRGFIHEMGAGEGYGYTLNIPLPPHSGDNDILSVFRDLVLPVINIYSPNVIVFQCGVDGYFRDPLTHLSYTHRCYIEIAKLLRKLKLPLVLCPGGGYSNDAPLLHLLIIAYLSYQESRISDIIKYLDENTPAELYKAYNSHTDTLIQRITNMHPIFKIVDSKSFRQRV